MFAAVLCICSWLSIPFGDMSFSMQSFGVFLCLSVLGGKLGSITVGIYLALGVAGLPVFTGFHAGISALLGATGGYIIGFMAAALVFWLITALWGRSAEIMAAVSGLLICYLFGTLWYSFGYLKVGYIGFSAALLKCVVPYIVPDTVKLVMVFAVSKRLRPYLHI